jgi:hypothetical protein
VVFFLSSLVRESKAIVEQEIVFNDRDMKTHTRHLQNDVMTYIYIYIYIQYIDSTNGDIDSISVFFSVGNSIQKNYQKTSVCQSAVEPPPTTWRVALYSPSLLSSELHAPRGYLSFHFVCGEIM